MSEELNLESMLRRLASPQEAAEKPVDPEELLRKIERLKSFSDEELAGLRKVAERGSAEDYLKLAVTYLIFQRKFDKAEAVTRQALKIYPDDGRIYYLLGESLLQQGKNEEAEVPLKKALELCPNHILAMEGLGYFYINQGRYKEAEDIFNNAVESDPDNTFALRGLGLCYRKQGKPEKARSAYQRAAELGDKTAKQYLEKFDK